jgi:adenylate cyclase
VAGDEATVRRFGADAHHPIPRSAYARILDRVRLDRAAVIALDVNFARAGDPAADRALLAALRRAQVRVVIAYKGDDAFVTITRDGRRTIHPEVLGRAAESIGVRTAWAGVPTDLDAKERRAEYLTDLEPAPASRTPTRRVPTFAFAAADLARGGTLGPIVYDLPTADRAAWDGQTRRSTWIDFAGPAGTVHRVSALSVLDGRAPPEAFRAKIVVIGVTAPSATSDMHATPYDDDRSMPGAELQANAITSMVDDSPLRSTSTLTDVLAILLLGGVPALAGLSGSRRWIAAAVVGVAITFVCAVQLAFQAGWIIAVVAPLGGLVVATGGVVMLRSRTRIRQHRAAQTTA